MTEESDVARHYSSGNLLSRLQKGLEDRGAKAPLAPGLLATCDEFYAGGPKALAAFVDQMKLKPEHCAVDLGCGLGGIGRYVTRQTSAAVVGVDITSEFVAAGQYLTEMSGLAGRVKHLRASILDLPFGDGLFDAAYLIQVGMNIADKNRIAHEAARVLKPGARFGIFDIMRLSEEDITYPVPWASSPNNSSVVSPERYRFALEDAGFDILAESRLSEHALQYYRNIMTDGKDVADPLGLQLILGANADRKVANLVENIRAGCIAPFVMIAGLPK
ncbi:MAG: hypothetical protein CML66_03515 [Rhodobacteraceae bacterium]|nr:hypothetical protein [Paracoccaceae bacterium]QEW21844.1 Sarcosine/dimethylglycine N-methyltransferase [Marinibacterium anthonyi]|tara:strand:- start:70 stop:894 length:825 start_codon:yes stop_codon:yes gene_type:complete